MTELKLQRFMRKIGYHFKQIHLLKQALTHRSLDTQLNYERLEFLGDALLGSIIAHYLYTHFSHQKEGQLTRMRATLVRQATLAQVARDLDLKHVMILSSGELKSGGHHRDSILSDMVEAVIGAIYLDCQDFEALRAIVLGWYQPYLVNIQPGDQLKDAKSRLQEYLQSKHQPLPCYEVIDIQGEAPHQHFKVQCNVHGFPPIIGEGSSRRFAEQNAAADLLKLME